MLFPFGACFAVELWLQRMAGRDYGTLRCEVGARRAQRRCSIASPRAPAGHDSEDATRCRRGARNEPGISELPFPVWRDAKGCTRDSGEARRECARKLLG